MRCLESNEMIFTFVKQSQPNAATWKVYFSN